MLKLQKSHVTVHEVSILQLFLYDLEVVGWSSFRPVQDLSGCVKLCPGSSIFSWNFLVLVSFQCLLVSMPLDGFWLLKLKAFVKVSIWKYCRIQKYFLRNWAYLDDEYIPASVESVIKSCWLYHRRLNSLYFSLHKGACIQLIC